MDYNFYMHILCVIVFCSGKKKTVLLHFALAPRLMYSIFADLLILKDIASHFLSLVP